MENSKKSQKLKQKNPWTSDSYVSNYRNEIYEKIKDAAQEAIQLRPTLTDSKDVVHNTMLGSIAGAELNYAHPDLDFIDTTHTIPEGRYVPKEELLFLKPKDIEHGVLINIDTFVNDLIEIKLNKNNLSEEECNTLYDELYDLVMKHKIEGTNDTP